MRSPITTDRSIIDSDRILAAQRPIIRGNGNAVQFTQYVTGWEIPSSSSIDDLFAGGGTYCIWFRSISLNSTSFNYYTYSPIAGAQGWIMMTDDYTSNYGVTNRLRLHVRYTTNAGQWKTPARMFKPYEWNNIIWRYNSDSITNNPLCCINGVEQTITEVVTPVGAAYLSDAGKVKRTTSTHGTLGQDIIMCKGMWSLEECQDYYFNAVIPSSYTKVFWCDFSTPNISQLIDKSGYNNHADIKYGTYSWVTNDAPFLNRVVAG